MNQFGVYLLVWGDALKCFLDNSTTIHLQSKRKNMSLDTICEVLLLLSTTKLKKLLNDIVPKDICHKIVSGRQDLVKHHLLFICCGSLKLLLNKTGPMLVLGELNNVVGKVAKLYVGETVIAEIFQQPTAVGLLKPVTTEGTGG